MITTLMLILGLATLVAGAELLVRGASTLALRCGITPLVVGLTVVAYGTSAPEMAVSVGAVRTGSADVAVGNVVGSNIFNILAILGLAAVVAPLAVHAQLVRFDLWVMLGVTGLTWLLALDGSLGRVEGAILLALGLGYTAWLIRKGRSEGADGLEKAAQRVAGDRSGAGDIEGARSTAVGADMQDDAARGNPSAGGGDGIPVARGNVMVSTLFILVGLGLLVLGARWSVAAAVAIAGAFGISELVIGLTIVAAGTSLPELATSVVAGLRGQRDIAVGNVVGSNIFNLLIILGVAALLAPEGIAVAPQTIRVDLLVAAAVAIACFPVFITGRVVSRAEGGLFLLGYAAYLAWLLASSARA